MCVCSQVSINVVNAGYYHNPWSKMSMKMIFDNTWTSTGTTIVQIIHLSFYCNNFTQLHNLPWQGGSAHKADICKKAGKKTPDSKMISYGGARRITLSSFRI